MTLYTETGSPLGTLAADRRGRRADRRALPRPEARLPAASHTGERADDEPVLACRANPARRVLRRPALRTSTCPLAPARHAVPAGGVAGTCSLCPSAPPPTYGAIAGADPPPKAGGAQVGRGGRWPTRSASSCPLPPHRRRRPGSASPAYAGGPWIAKARLLRPRAPMRSAATRSTSSAGGRSWGSSFLFIRIARAGLRPGGTGRGPPGQAARWSCCPLLAPASACRAAQATRGRSRLISVINFRRAVSC